MKIKYFLITAVLAMAILSAGLIGAQNVSAQVADNVVNWCHDFNTNLKYGDKGNEVWNLEVALKKEGFEADSADGHYFYEKTASAVVQFQEKYVADVLTPSGLTHGTGFVSPATRAKLNSLYGCTKVSCTDTDGGKDYFTKGTTSWTYYTGSGFKTAKTTDFCSTPGGGNALAEYYCDGNASKLETVNCENGCENGACKKPNPPANNCRYDYVDGSNIGNIYKETSDLCKTTWDTFSLGRPGSKVYYNGTLIHTYLPYITITSPNNNDLWTAGQTQNITWTSAGLENKNVSIVYRVVANGKPAGSITYLARKNILATAGSYSWNIPSDFPAGKYVIYIDQNIPTSGAEKDWKNISKVYVKIASPSWCYTFSEDLYSGVPKPKQVRALQTVLRAEELYGGDIDGVFDTNVKKAVQDFQKKNGISPNNGRFGPTTREKMNALYGCKEVKPSITVTSPNGGETWKIGETKNITWTASGLPNGDYDRIIVSAVDFSGGAIEYSIATLLPSQRSYSWVVPVETSQGNITGGNKFKIRVVYLALIGNNAEDYSDNFFSISAADSSVDSLSVFSNTTATSSPTIKLTSPNGGETWQNGQNHSIAFTYSGANRGKVYLYLINDSISDPSNQYKTIPIENGYGYAIYDISLSNGVYSWTIPNDQYKYSPGSKYKIRAYWYAFSNDGASLGSFSDTSDNYFSISAAGTPVPASCVPSWTYTAWSACANSQQTRTVTDLNNCGVTTGKPSESQLCSTAVVATCTDTDGGKDYSVRGAVKDTKYPNPYTADGLYTDLCYAGLKQIFEYYCDASLGYSQGEWRVCPNGCSSGACNKTAALVPSEGNSSQDLVASISAAIARIAQQIQQLLSAGQ